MDIGIQRAPSRVTANIIEHIPLRGYLQCQAELGRSRSPIPHAAVRSHRREEIYRNLVKKNSKFEVDKVFAGAPDFFKNKIGLSTDVEKNGGGQPPGSKSSPQNPAPSFFARRAYANVNIANPPRFKGYERGAGDADGRSNKPSVPHKIHGSSSKSSLASIVSNTNTTATSRSSRAKTKPDWKYVGKTNCRDTYSYCSSINEPYAPPPTLTRAELFPASQSKRPLETLLDGYGDVDVKTSRYKPSPFIPKTQAQPPRPAKKEKAESMSRVVAVNGSVVSFPDFGFASFSNWFAEAKCTKKSAGFRTEFDLSGYTTQEICMYLYNGNRLVIEASRPFRGHIPAMLFKESIVLPKDLPVESLFISRTDHGVLIIERAKSNSRG